MKLIIKLILRILANAAAIWVAARIIPGFIFRGSNTDLLIAGAVLGIVNSFIRPIIKLITLPVILLTLGIFSVIINIAMLYLVANILPTLVIHGFWAAFWGTIVISLVNSILLSLFKHD
jgi:putative membrane protein